MKKRYLVLIMGILVVVVLAIKFQTSETNCFEIYRFTTPDDEWTGIYDAYSRGEMTKESLKKSRDGKPVKDRKKPTKKEDDEK